MTVIPLRDKPASTITITKEQLLRLRPAVGRPTDVGRAFNVLWLRCDDLGLTTYCALAHCRGRGCSAEHYLDYESFLQLPTAAVAGVDQGGAGLSEIVRLVQERVRLGELTSR